MPELERAGERVDVEEPDTAVAGVGNAVAEAESVVEEVGTAPVGREVCLE